MFEFLLLGAHLFFILSLAHCLVSRLWPPDALRYNKLKVVSSLPPDGGLVTSLSAKWHSLLMHLELDDLFLVEDILHLNLPHLG